MSRFLASALLASLASLTMIVGAQNGSLPPVNPPGRLIDVGGWRLHLNCTGARSATAPLVILEAGIGDFSVEWSLVQPGVATFARVCSYDRAGDGWSDHAGVDDPLRLLGDGRLVRSSDLVTGQAIPAVQTSNPLRESDIPPVALRQMTAGLADASLHANQGPRDKLPIEAQRMRTWALGQVKHVAAGVNPYEHEQLAALRTDRAKARYPLGDMPLVVLTAASRTSTDPMRLRLRRSTGRLTPPWLNSLVAER